MKYVDIFGIEQGEDVFFSKEEVEKYLKHPITREIFSTLKLRIVTFLNMISSEPKIDQVRMLQGSLQELEYFMKLPDLLKEENANQLEARMEPPSIDKFKKRS